MVDATVAERFWAQVHKAPGDDCWEWAAGRNAAGYGVIYAHRRQWTAHRLSWVLSHGAIPDGLYVLHRCDNPPCVRPDHLFVGTGLDNVRDAAAKGRRWHQRTTTCPNGHPWEGNSRRQYNGWRRCRICANVAQRKYERKLQEERRNAKRADKKAG